MPSESQKITYEEKIHVIDQELKKRQHKWHLNALAWFDFEDVEQIIRLHIHKKWHQWDQIRPLEPWVNKIITNQLKNILRNHYTNFARPCLNCPFNQEKVKDVKDSSYKDSPNKEHAGAGSLCAFTPSGLQCNECALYKKWEKTKKHAYDIKLPLTIEHHSTEVYQLATASYDLDNAAARLHDEMKNILSEKHYEIYSALFIENTPEDEIAKKLGYKTTEKGRKAGYKQLKNLKRMFKERATKVISQEDIIIFYD